MTDEERAEVDKLAEKLNVSRHALLRFAILYMLSQVREGKLKLKDYVSSKRSLSPPN